MENISKGQINRAGKELLKDDVDISNAREIIQAWRSEHVFALNSLHNRLTELISEFSKGRETSIMIANRLKRFESILKKQRLNPTTCLSRLQDVAGIRLIFDDALILEAFLKFLNFRDIKYIRQSDYIKNPKETGYRSLHQVFRVNSELNSRDYLVEVQFRTRVQHAWATTVEIVDNQRNENLKSGQGSNDWTRFFQLVGWAFVFVEPGIKTDVNDSVSSDEVSKSQVLSRESTFNDLISFSEFERLKSELTEISKKKPVTVIDIEEGSVSPGGWYLVKLKNKDSQFELEVQSFSDVDINTAVERYGLIESNESSLQTNVVLVKAASRDSLKDTYPNYYVDLSKFTSSIKYIERVDAEAKVTPKKTPEPIEADLFQSNYDITKIKDNLPVLSKISKLKGSSELAKILWGLGFEYHKNELGYVPFISSAQIAKNVNDYCDGVHIHEPNVARFFREKTDLGFTRLWTVQHSLCDQRAMEFGYSTGKRRKSLYLISEDGRRLLESLRN